MASSNPPTSQPLPSTGTISSAARLPSFPPQSQPQSQRPPSTAAPPPPAATSTTPASATAQQNGAGGGTGFRPLNVRDALQYLDRVKQQFANEYEVYDQFLTIMKDFKTQNIDTPGVIDRVSTLFRGHPSLIQGFNTFLPPGYRIECHVSPNADGSTGGPGSSNVITVTTPMGVTTRTQNVSGPASSAPSTANSGPASSSNSSSLPPSHQTNSTQPTPSTSRPTSSTAPAPPARLPPLPNVPAQPAPPRPISPPAPIPPFGGAANARDRNGGASAWQQQQNGGGVGGYGQTANNANRGRTTTQPNAGGMSAQQQQPPRSTQQVPPPPAPLVKPNPTAPAQEHQQQQQAQARPGQPISHPTPPPQPSTEAATPTPTTSTPAGGPQIMEFNHAITYVNKIKTRFAKEPETYKTFLEILQTYQKDGRPIQEVYQQVTALFRDAPDLLDEFKAFLPDTSGEASQPQHAGGPSPAAKQKAQMGQQKFSSTSNGVAGTSRKPVEMEKKKRAAPGMGEKSKAKRAKTAHQQQQQQVGGISGGGIESPPIGGPASIAAVKQHQQASMVDPSLPPSPFAPHHPHVGQPHPYGAAPPGFPGAPHLQSAYDAYLTTHRSPPLVQPEEFGFFDRVKKYLDDRAAYTEFLKLLNLYTQEIIDLATLLHKSLLFIGSNDELVAQFKQLVGWDPVKDGRVEGEDWIIDNEPVLDRPPVLLHLMKAFGPSYRRLPDSEIDLACSGRSALDWSVLNDEWVAYATWASEGSGAHRKNPYEEALYNSEQERHWYSFHLASIARTIAHFEPIAARIALMNAEERTELKIVNDDGQLVGSAPSVYERIIKKIYGKDHGWEILQALEDNPAVAVPIVLARLKQKDEEWKRAEKEWNKVWREVDAKNFYRALDHQGIPFKAVDKKLTTTSKALTNEIEGLRRDKRQKRFDVPTSKPIWLDPASTITSAPATDPFAELAADEAAPLRPSHQFEFHMSDRSVLFDVLKLTFSYLDRDQSGFSIPERARVEAFLRLFVPLLWGVEKDEMEENLGQSAHDDAADVDEDEVEADQDGLAASDGESSSPLTTGGDTDSSSPSSGRRGINGTVSNKRGGAADLRKRLLQHAAATASRNSAAANGTTPATDDSTVHDAVNGGSEEPTWIHLSETTPDGQKGTTAEEVLNPRKYSFFANSTFYCLVRVIHVMYHRLLSFKQLVTHLAESGQHRRLAPLGPELGLSLPVGVVDTGDNPAEHYYGHALELAEKLFDGDIDYQTYEEQLRYMAGIRAYPLFTLDKLISTVIKHIHTINSDAKCQDIVTLLEADRARPATTPRQQIAYRMEVESILGADENLYRIEWIPDVQAMSIQLLGKEELTIDEAYQSEAKLYQSWLASYALTSPSEGIGATVKAPLLKRNRAQAHDDEEEEGEDLELSPGLEVKVNSGAYRLFFVANTEDYLHRRRKVETPVAAPTTKGKGKAKDGLDQEEGEVNEDENGSMDEDKETETSSKEEEDVPVQQKRKERFERWLESRTVSRVPEATERGDSTLAASLPPLPSLGPSDLSRDGGDVEMGSV